VQGVQKITFDMQSFYYTQKTYTMDGKPDKWRVVYYPLIECGKTGEKFDEPRALVEKVGATGFWHKEVPLRYLSEF